VNSAPLPEWFGFFEASVIPSVHPGPDRAFLDALPNENGAEFSSLALFAGTRFARPTVVTSFAAAHVGHMHGETTGRQRTHCGWSSCPPDANAGRRGEQGLDAAAVRLESGLQLGRSHHVGGLSVRHMRLLAADQIRSLEDVGAPAGARDRETTCAGDAGDPLDTAFAVRLGVRF
jgi:hypothetical protein